MKTALYQFMNGSRKGEGGGGEIATNPTDIYNFQHDTENVRLQANFVL